MTIVRLTATATLLAFLAAASSADAAGPQYTNPANTDADFDIQGEYVGEIPSRDGGKERFGIQIIALGEGKFHAVGYHGGLPGDGWNGEEKIESDSAGPAVNGAVTFNGEHGAGVVKDGMLTVYNDDKVRIAEFQKAMRQSPTLGKAPPDGAIVLFDGTNADQWQGGRVTDDGLLMEGTTSKRAFGDHQLHIEFRLPYQPEDRGQGRGNSGIYVQGRYEVQMLDSFGLAGKDNECGGIYSVKAPDVNMCLPPLSWQTYDIQYTAAKYDGDKLVTNPRMTVYHNGVLIHKDVELPGERSTTAAPSKPGNAPGPIYLQNHGCPLRYRNIWVVEGSYFARLGFL